MSLIITINGKDYLPIRAATHVTSGVIDEQTLAKMIGDPEAFMDEEFDEVITAFRVVAGELQPLRHNDFALAAKAGGNGHRSNRAPSATVVNVAALKEKFEICVGPALKRHPHLADPTKVWNLNPKLTTAERVFIVEGLIRTQENNRSTVSRELERALDSVEDVLNKGGLSIDRGRMPGKKSDWIKVFHHFAPTIRRSESVMHDYFTDLKLKWPPGQRPETFDPVAKALGM